MRTRPGTGNGVRIRASRRSGKTPSQTISATTPATVIVERDEDQPVQQQRPGQRLRPLRLQQRSDQLDRQQQPGHRQESQAPDDELGLRNVGRQEIALEETAEERPGEQPRRCRRAAGASGGVITTQRFITATRSRAMPSMSDLDHQLPEDMLERRQLEQLAQPQDRIVSHDLAVVEDDDVGRDPFDALEHVRAVDHHPALGGERLDQAAQHQRRRDVEAGVRLVEDDDLRIVQQRRRDQDLLPHPLGYADSGAWASSVRLNSVRKPSVLASIVACGRPRSWPTSDRYSGPGEIGVKNGFLGDVADPGLVIEDVVADVVAVEMDGAAGRFEEAREDRDGRRFPGTIRPQQPEHAPRLQRERHATHRLDRRVVLRQQARFEHAYRTPQGAGSSLDVLGAWCLVPGARRARCEGAGCEGARCEGAGCECVLRPRHPA